MGLRPERLNVGTCYVCSVGGQGFGPVLRRVSRMAREQLLGGIMFATLVDGPREYYYPRRRIDFLQEEVASERAAYAAFLAEWAHVPEWDRVFLEWERPTQARLAEAEARLAEAEAQ